MIESRYILVSVNRNSQVVERGDNVEKITMIETKYKYNNTRYLFSKIINFNFYCIGQDIIHLILPILKFIFPSSHHKRDAFFFSIRLIFNSELDER